MLMNTTYNPIVQIDNNHIELIYGLILSNKPKSCLELGIGSGLTTKKIIEAFEYNKIIPNIDCVDNFYDWSGNIPQHIKELNTINLIMSDEYSYIQSCKKKYDFIISDADHMNAHKWVKETIDLCNNNGIIIYHDVTNPIFPNLYEIILQIKKLNLRYFLFNRNSLSEERCDRGLLVIQK